MRAAFRRLGRSGAAVLFAAAASCADTAADLGAGKSTPPRAVRVRILALGDSYTAGESVPGAKSWPRQLAAALVPDSVIVTDLTVIARTGWTTTDLVDTLGADSLASPYDLVTLQIGVNNQYQHLDFSVFQSEFPALVARAIALAGNRPGHVVVLSIPDYSVTPVGSQIDPDRVRAEIDGYNGFIASATDSVNVLEIDITEISRRAQEDPTLTARDGLHPSAKMYALWVDVVRPVVAGILERR